MRISIVTPVFNDVRVGRALESIFAQKHEHQLETIVIDAGSTDGTMDVLERYRSDVDILISEPDRGIYDGMNKGIQLSTGDVVGILNADDRYSDPHVLTDVLDTFADESVDAAYGDIVYMDEAGAVSRYWRSGAPGLWAWYLGWMPPHPSFFVRKRVYDKYGVFDLDFSIAADYELMLRFVVKHRITTKYMRRVLVNMAPGGNSTKSIANIVKANLEVGRACRNNGLRGGFLVPFLKPARKILQLVSRP